MARSLKVSLQYSSQVKASLLSAGFPTQQDFAEKLGMSRATVSKFFNGKLVGRLNFMEMCNALGFKWEDIADFSNASNQEITQELIHSTTEQEDYYIERFPIEEECLRAILQRGALVIIKGPHQIGKTSLMNKILKYAETQKCQSVFISLQSADSKIFENLEIFLKWFCFNITHKLNLPNKIEDYWDDIFGSKISTQCYFEQYILSSLSVPLVLGIDEMNILCSYPDLADDFFGLLRAWHEESKNRTIWQKLSLIVARSTEVYIPLKVNQSPFNVGILIELPYLNEQQIQLLAQKHEINLSENELKLLKVMIGGQPYLTQLTFQRLKYKDVTLKKLLETATDEDSIYRDHLREKLLFLNQDTTLSQPFKKILLSKEGVDIDLTTALKLESLGLVQLKNGQAFISLKLYRDYFLERLNLLNCD